ncbi:MAG: sulfur carrier protein ThiS [Acidobacteriota bacterium]
MSSDGNLDIVVNGEPMTVAPLATVADLLDNLGRHPQTVAVEHNGLIVSRQRYGDTPLRRGDRLEIVQFVQGG